MVPADIVSAEVVTLGEDLRRAIGAFVRVVRCRSGTPGSAQSETLALLEQEGDVNVAALAERRRVKHQTMRMVVAQLEEAGLVVRSPDPADRRSQLVTLMPAGRAELARERDARASGIDELIATRLTAPERATLRAAVVLLDRMIAENG